MAAVRSVNAETVIAVEPKRMFKAMADWPNVLPKAAPHIVSSVSILQGDGGVGSIITQTNVQNAKGVTGGKAKVDVVDEDNLVYKYSVLEGVHEGKEAGPGKCEVKFSPHSGGGCVATIKFETDSENGLTKAHEPMPEILKVLEQYLLSNPTAYA
eukprot:Gb_11196 [translate_table: standard]